MEALHQFLTKVIITLHVIVMQKMCITNYFALHPKNVILQCITITNYHYPRPGTKPG